MTRPAAEQALVDQWKGKAKKRTGPGGALSSPRTRPDASEDNGEGEESGTILRAPESARDEFGRRWKAGQSVFYCHVSQDGEVEPRCLDADGLLDLLSRALRASSPSVFIKLPDTDTD